MDVLKVGLVAIFVAAGMSGCVAGGEGVQAVAPGWKSGYVWAFDESYYGEDTYVDEDGTYNDTWDDQRSYAMEVLNTTTVFNNTIVYIVAEQESDRQSSWLHGVRARDLADVWLDIDLDWDCDSGGCTPEVESIDSYYEPPEFLRFPLSAGTSYELDFGPDEDWEADFFAATARVRGPATVETGVGLVDSIRVDFVFELVDPDGYRARLQQEIDEDGEDIQIEEFDVQLLQTESVYYSQAYQQVVKREYLYDEVWNVAFVEDGERIEFSGDTHGGGEKILTGARLVAKPERSLAEAALYIAGDRQVLSPVGQTVDSAAYTIAILADRKVINAATEESFDFSARTDGVEAIPAGHTLHWILEDGLGNRVAAANATQFTATPPRAGAYSIIVEARNEEAAVVASDNMLVYANWVGTARAACGDAWVAGVAVMGACDELSVDVLWGARSVTIDGTASGAGLSAGGESMVVYDAWGVRVNGGSTSFAMELGGYPLDPETGWSVVWEFEQAVDMDVEYNIQVLYTDSPLLVEAETVGKLGAFQDHMARVRA